MTVKRMTLLERRGDITFADFDSHWAGPHGDLAKGFPGLARYHQNPVQTTVGADRHGIAGIVELWFADDAGMRDALASPVAAALVEDEPNFLSGITILAVDEVILKPHQTPLNAIFLIDEGAVSPSALSTWCADSAALPGVDGLTVNMVAAASKRDTLGALSRPPLAVVALTAPQALLTPLAAQVDGTLYHTAQRRIV